uniref:NADH-quinone oxidoreductase subunit 5 family protein n=1 Tax=Eubacterium cellulosolvens TaxID=29322 RepID=UPI000481B6A3|nr:proton-conducting transporter membrane subunit [[Eubacterium] cellulosolvens]
MVVPFLICFPMIVAVLMFCIRVNRVRNAIAYASAVIIMIGVAVLTAQWLKGGMQPMILAAGESSLIELCDHVILAAEIVLMFVVTFLSFKYRKYWISLLSIVPTLMIAYFELFGPEMAPEAKVRIDYLAILMCIIIGLIGGLIVIYAVGYMHGYAHHHVEFEDRRYYFFMLLFIFLGAMFGFVTSDSLLWIDFFWEVTSVCSFMLIGYTREPVAITNSFRALWMNLLGGTLLAIGIIYFGYQTGTVSLQKLISLGADQAKYAVIPVAFMAFAALTKAAQLPFSPWLMGAMVAPTPSSALLHSATMVKAGIYVLIRLAPAMSGQQIGMMVSIIGGFTFFLASIMAIAQTDAKKVLAFSTISNLGLMVACTGVGRPETIWAATFLMIFHAVSKSLLFQDVGATENAMHTRDIEEFHGLLYRLPRLAIFQFIGIAGMFLAPFGMLISKWSALKASVDERNIILVMFIIFGSATTSFYWTKWMGKLIAATRQPKVRDITKTNENISLTIHAILMLGLCVLFPVLSQVFVDPMIAEQFGSYKDVLPMAVLYILIAVILVVFAVPFIAFRTTRNTPTNIKLSYMNGINTGDNTQFTDSFGGEKKLTLTNYYFAHKIGQRKLMIPSQLFATAVIIVMLVMIIGGVA